MKKIRLMATELEDETLLARLAGGDLIAIEAKYHKACPTKLYTRFRTFQRKKSSDDNAEENIVTSRVFVELIEYIDNETQSKRTSIALTELHELYVRRLQQFGFGAYVHKTHLKERILKHFPECKPEFDGRNIVLLFDNTLRIMVRETLKQSADLDAMTLMKAAKIIRRDILSLENLKFTGHFPQGCQKQSVPPRLLTLLPMIMHED